VTWEHVRGHTGDPANERANMLAQAFAQGQTPALSSYTAEEIVTPSRSYPYYLSLVGGELECHPTWEECRARVHGVSGARFKNVS
jgi:ribonuclease HI